MLFFRIFCPYRLRNSQKLLSGGFLTPQKPPNRRFLPAERPQNQDLEIAIFRDFLPHCGLEIAKKIMWRFFDLPKTAKPPKMAIFYLLKDPKIMT